MDDAEIASIKGRLLACEAVLTHLIWAIARNSQHPPAALALLWKEVEEGMAMISEQPGLDRAAIAAAREAIAGMGESLLGGLTEEALRRTARTDQGPH